MYTVYTTIISPVEGGRKAISKYILLPKISERRERKKWYCTESIKHPAKAQIGIMQWILNKFCIDGEVILDPMVGIGTTLIEAIKLYPNTTAIGIEYESKFVKMTNDNINKAHRVALSDLFMRRRLGKAICVQGDARELNEVFPGKVDRCIFSPPYSGTIRKGGEGPGVTADPGRWKRVKDNLELRQGYSLDPKNIGNLRHGNINNIKSETYLSEMLKVYLQCYRVLGFGRSMILITKDFISDKKRIPLTQHTIVLCEMAGFKYITTYYRKIENPSFWRVLYQQKYPQVEQIDSEDITVFNKMF